MTGLHLYIPTRGRVDRQVTLGQLPPSWLRRTIVVCAAGEAISIDEQFPELSRVRQVSTKNIAAKRARIFKMAHVAGHKKIMMLDDDLVFSVRKAVNRIFEGVQRPSNDRWKAEVRRRPELAQLRPALPTDVDKILQRVERLLDFYAHVGIGPRYMNQQHPGELLFNTKATHALGYQVDTVFKACKLGQVDRFEDLDYTLQLLRAGHQNAVTVWAAVNEPHGYNAPGGVSLYRTAKAIDAGARKLAALHPGLVRVVDRVDRNGDTKHKGGTRLVISWKKAYGYNANAELLQ